MCSLVNTHTHTHAHTRTHTHTIIKKKKKTIGMRRAAKKLGTQESKLCQGRCATASTLGHGSVRQNTTSPVVYESCLVPVPIIKYGQKSRGVSYDINPSFLALPVGYEPHGISFQGIVTDCDGAPRARTKVSVFSAKLHSIDRRIDCSVHPRCTHRPGCPRRPAGATNPSTPPLRPRALLSLPQVAGPVPWPFVQANAIGSVIERKKEKRKRHR